MITILTTIYMFFILLAFIGLIWIPILLIAFDVFVAIAVIKFIAHYVRKRNKKD